VLFSQNNNLAFQDHLVAVLEQAALRSRYAKPSDRESAYELLQKKFVQQEQAEQQARSKPAAAEPKPKKSRGRKQDSYLESITKTTINTVGRQVARELVRGILGSFLRK